MKQFFNSENFGEKGLITKALNPRGAVKTSFTPTFSFPIEKKRKKIIGFLRTEKPVHLDDIRTLVRSKDPALVGAGACLMAMHPDGKPDAFDRMSEYFIRNPEFHGLAGHTLLTQIDEARDNLLSDEKFGLRNGRTMGLGLGNDVELRLLTNRKPTFATTYPIQAAETAAAITSIVDGLSKKYGKDFYGVSIGGSFAKGGWAGGSFDRSDIDYCVFAKDKRIEEEFRAGLVKANLTPCHAFGSFSNLEEKETNPLLFSGILFREKKSKPKLYRIQYEQIKHMTNEQWYHLVSIIHDSQVNLNKLSGRLWLDRHQEMTLKAIRCLQFVPPYSKNEMLMLMKKDPRYALAKQSHQMATA